LLFHKTGVDFKRTEEYDSSNKAKAKAIKAFTEAASEERALM